MHREKEKREISPKTDLWVKDIILEERSRNKRNQITDVLIKIDRNLIGESSG
jgi:hypothetical protein